MAHFNPSEAFDTLKQKVSETVKEQFPVEGKKNTLHVKRVWVDDNKNIDDIRSQEDAKIRGRNWAVPVRAEFELRDNRTGKVKDRQVLNIAQLPKITNRYTYIVGGNEWQVNNQFRLKSGVYTHVKANGELASQWNLAKGLNFNMDFKPKTKKMTIQFSGKSANVPLYPILKTLGVDDDTIERRWGKEILNANKKDNSSAALKKFYKAFKGENPKSLDDARNLILEEFGRTELRPEATKLTLGKEFSQVDGEALLTGSHRILKVSRQEEKPDDRDSLQFKDLYSAEDLIADRLMKGKARWDARRKIVNNLDKQDKVAKIVNPDIFGRPVRSFFTQSNLSDRPDQMNPMSYIGGNRRTTIWGEGGITTKEQVTTAAKLVNPSHMGFLDPIHTPESEKTGTVLQLALGAKKRGTDLEIPVYNMKTGKREMIDASKAMSSNVAYPDQFMREGGKFKPVDRLVKISDKEGNTVLESPSKVDYVLSSPKGMFDLSANLIPFLGSDQGNRAMMATKQIEQAVALNDREAPLVQVKSEGPATFEKIVGGFTSHQSPVDGVVESVSKKSVKIRDKESKLHEVQLYNDFPLNDDKSVLNSTATVAKGQTVRKNQVVADTNFTKDGVLAMGKNLRVAYMPWKGYNFEDGIVISETAAKKLTSEHMHRNTISKENNIILDKKKFTAEVGAVTPKKSIDKLGDDGVIQVGQKVEQGDILVGALRVEEVTPEQQQLGLFSKKFIKPVRPRPITWDKDTPGIVTRVAKQGKKTTVYVRTNAPADIGDKIVGRHANKGIITNIIPDHEMPQDKNGNPMEVLLNPVGIPGRINVGQVLETAASKIAKKTGKPYVVNNFDPNNKDYTRNLMAELKKHGLSDTDDLVDPSTGRKYDKVLNGDQYIYKLHHTAVKGLSARSRGAYDSNMTPRGGGPQGGQTMDAMGLYAMLAHNARENIREMQSYKSDKNDDFWAMLQAGDSVPTPKTPFVWKKFEGYLKGMGIDIDKQGNDMILQPLTDKKVLQMSNGALKDPGRSLIGRNLKPEKGGIFDPEVTGTKWPAGRFGDKWSHITLAERMPNPVFESPMRSLLGLNTNEFKDVVSGKKDINGERGPSAIVKNLKKINVDKEISDLEAQLPDLRTSNLNIANKRLKYLRALKRTNMSPTEAYTMKYVPVLPPSMRPVGVLDDGTPSFDDTNKLYNMLANTNDQLKKFDPKVLPIEEADGIRTELYDGLKSLTLTGAVNKGRHLNSIATTIAGKGSPKVGFFQSKVIGKRQDLSMRSTIVPEPSLSLDEVGIPRKAAQELYKPFVVSRLRRQGMSPLQAQREIKNNTSGAAAALENVMAERPIILKRDPVLHKFGVQSFMPKIVEGKAIKIHPLATSGYNADFDGDKMSAYVPVSQAAVKESFKMLPSANLFSPATANVMFKPSDESMLGLYKLTEVKKGPVKKFKNAAEAARAVKDGKLGINDLISLDDVEGDIGSMLKLGASKKTTVGRLMVANTLPKDKREKFLASDKTLTKKDLNVLLTSVAQENQTDFGGVSDQLKNMGNEYATGFSIGLEDFVSDKAYRDRLLRITREEEKKVRNSRLSADKKEDRIVALYSRAGNLLEENAKKKVMQSDNRMYDWIKSGAKNKWPQYKQMTVSPWLVSDVLRDRIIPIPIDKSYSEGLDVSSYWAANSGARGTIIQKAEGTWRPGLMGKQIMQTTMNQMVVDEDCGTNRGRLMKPDDRGILNRYTVGDISLGVKGRKDKGTIPSGTLITPDVVRRLKNNKIPELTVRSPLKCQHGKGICAKCYGVNENGQLYQPGENVGVIAAQALGEPATQLSMNAFHTGGVAGAKGSKSSATFERLDQLTKLPKILPGSATLSHADGRVNKVAKDPAGGWNVYVGNDRHYVPGSRTLQAKVGATVRRGDALSSGPKNPREMLPLTGLNSVQSYLTDEIQKVYEDQNTPLFKRNVETFVRAMTNLSEVIDPGDHELYLRGDKIPTSEINAYNKRDPKKPVRHRPILQGVEHLPLDMQEDWVARLQSRELRDTILNAASEGWRSQVHSTHPIPGMAVAKEFGKGTKEEPWLY